MKNLGKRSAAAIQKLASVGKSLRTLREEQSVKNPLIDQAKEAALAALAATWQMYNLMRESVTAPEEEGPGCLIAVDQDGNPLAKKKHQMCKHWKIGKCVFKGDDCIF